MRERDDSYSTKCVCYNEGMLYRGVIPIHFTIVGEIKIIPYVLLPPVGPGCNPDITDNSKLYSLT